MKRWDSSSANFLSNQTARFLLIYVFMIIRCFRWLCSSKALRSGMWFYFFPKWGSVLFFEDKRISQFFAKCGNAHEMFVYILYPWREALRELLCFSFPIDSWGMFELKDRLSKLEAALSSKKGKLRSTLFYPLLFA